MIRKSFGALGALAAIAAIVTALLALPAAGAGQEGSKSGLYIVQLASAPVVAYEGGVAGIAATAPAAGEKIDPLSPKVVKYSDHLKGEHQKALDKVGGGQKLYDYTYSYNGFAARLSSQQAAALKLQGDVVAVSKNEIVYADTSSTPTFLGLDAPGGLWEQLGGTGAKKDSGAGEGIIIGDIDSGIWPENPSFSDRDADGKLSYQQIPGWHGKCTPGEGFTASNCNQKLIGAQYFNAAQGGNAGIDVDRPWEFNSARDYNGHGSHTAGTAGGNFGVQATGPAAAFGKVSGIAPRARIAVYKALWSTEDASTAGGATADLVAAIDQAVADGVDVINYSISGSQTNFADPVMIAYLFAARAGIFVSTSAGNSGPAVSTVAHPSPWVTTVAAGTHNRNGAGSVTLGNGATYTGASVATAVPSAGLIDATAAGVAGANATQLRLCYGFADGAVVLDPAKVAGKIVVCDRGTTGRTNKSLAVQQAGGIGMILTNTNVNSINADFHFVPTVHLLVTDRAAVKTYAATTGASASIAQATLTYTDPAPFTASFSSRGPLKAGGGDLLKPDVIAPGQDILAAVAPPGNAGREFNLYSGTSMSAPHVTGLAALLKQKYPSWSPMAIKSALMTSAGDVLDEGGNTSPSVIFSQGAGHVAPNRAANPGLVYDAGWTQWLAFLCGNSSAVGAATCNSLKAAGYSTDASDMNVASIAIGDLAGVQTVKRTVTNVGGAAATYTPSFTGLVGIDRVVTPTTLSIPAGGSASFTVKFTRTTATLGEYVGGQLTWSDGTHFVRSPVVLKPVALAAPAEVTGTGGPLSWSVTTGYAGSLVFAAQGLVPATTTAWTVAQDPDQTFDPAVTVGTYSKTFTVPAGLTAFRVGIYENAIAPTGTDLDLFVYDEDSEFVAQSADGDSNEEVTLRAPAAGTYTVYIHGYLTNGPSASGTLFSWQVGSANAGNMTVPAPAAATVGGPVPVSVSFTGLAAATRYFGAVAYSDGTNNVGSTLVTVNKP